jgi:hemerythrin
MAFVWDESMATGVKELDEAHRTLFLWVDKLGEAMKQGKGKSEVLGILDFLGKYAASHFACEEDCMNRYQCPLASTNKRQHDEFLLFFTKTKAEVEANGVKVRSVLELQETLGNWLRHHIKKVDVSLKPCVKPH